MKRPNILLITSDQQHWDTLGAFNSELSTPNLDRLVQEGTTFTRAYCPNPTCTPTRASIITGMYPSQHGAWTLGTKLFEDRHTVGEDFQEASYRTALVGKAHFQPLRATEAYSSLESVPLLQDLEFWRTFDQDFYGFDHVELARNHTNEFLVGQHYALWMEEKGCTNWRDYFLAPTGTMDPSQLHHWDIPEEYHYNTWIAERTNALLEQYKNSEENFFLWSSFFDPHPDYLVPVPWDTMYDPNQLTIPTVTPGEHNRNPPHFGLTQETEPDFSHLRESGFGIHGYHSHTKLPESERKQLVATYYGMISCMDKYIGRILDRLDELGLADNTIVVFTTDHGHFFGQHGLQYKGGFHYEDLIKLPFIVRYPGHVPAGRTSPAIQSLVDLAPTFLSMAGIPIPHHMTGVDQSRVWTGKASMARDHAICEFRHEPTTIHQKTYVGERYKITVYYNQTYGEIFDLQEDPGEIRNLWNDPEYAALKSELLLRYIWAELGKESMPMPRIWGA
ncbi:sulfatase-like hydrolase/transferase [Paenibacillus sp. CGMCC 1.16610]|uniref:Sulfatase-like hydrolase/transferase n=1 Tax=Paenibacillus anseongense TaxID=2682845 RepID=A0ABW9U4U6_9BACL|nr:MULTISPECIES: sulfatase-like hydrolase/transferase [Paenibacillus]MBA2940872.1 sulfatase-like hydrolase/transferase [Paenibacillus sp. CGMCC 1.16610]MVQ34056.1 sulfatase-like hydrolase/transferase [Paenibacillus anseongense]